MEPSGCDQSGADVGLPLEPPGHISNHTDFQPLVRPEVIRLHTDSIRTHVNHIWVWTVIALSNSGSRSPGSRPRSWALVLVQIKSREVLGTGSWVQVLVQVWVKVYVQDLLP